MVREQENKSSRGQPGRNSSSHETGAPLRWVSDSEVAPQALEVASGQGFGENICSVVLRAHACECDGAFLHQIADVVELDADVFYVRVANVVLCQPTSSVVVAQERSGVSRTKAKASEEFGERQVREMSRGVRYTPHSKMS
jgi:hypothetical protein